MYNQNDKSKALPARASIAGGSRSRWIAALVLIVGVSVSGLWAARTLPDVVLGSIVSGYTEIVVHSRSQDAYVPENWNWHRAAFGYGVTAAAGRSLDLSQAKKEFSDAPKPWLVYYTFLNLPSAFEQSFRQLFAENLIAKKNKWMGQEVYYYNGHGLKAVFAMLYRPPSKALGGKTLGSLYQANAQAYVRANLPMVAALLTGKSPAKAQLAWVESQIKAKQAKGQYVYVPGLLYQARSNLGVEGDDRLFGAIVRRQMDGTLPLLRPLFVQFLRDYDPEMYKQYKGKL